jgi:agmatine/peptidylarginine deiminase
MIKPDYAKVNSLFLTYPENFDHEYHELAPFFEGLISLCPPDITCFVIVNNDNSARYIKKIFKNKDVRPIVVSEFYEVWLRDIMGFACDGFVLKPKFRPDYCKDIYTDDYINVIDEQTRYIINKTINVPIKNCDLVWDGGNLGTNGKEAFVIDKIVRDNEDVDLKDYFTKELNLELFILPQNKYDCLGHTDGCFQFINSKEIFLSKLPDKECFEYDISILDIYYKKFEELSFVISRICDNPILTSKNGISDARGVFTNFLLLNDNIFFPYFDKQKSYLCNTSLVKNNSSNILEINSTGIGIHGGGLHCSSFVF